MISNKLTVNYKLLSLSLTHFLTWNQMKINSPSLGTPIAPLSSSTPLPPSPGSTVGNTSSQIIRASPILKVGGGGFQYRKSPYEMVTMKDAVNRIMNELVSTTKLESQKIGLKNSIDLLDRRVSSDIQSKVDVPSFPASIKDGYAVITSDGPGTRKVISSSITAGLPADGMTIDKGWCVRINTGAPVPDGCDAVVQVEDTEVTSRTDVRIKQFSIHSIKI